jgi:hypothetical protein
MITSMLMSIFQGSASLSHIGGDNSVILKFHLNREDTVLYKKYCYSFPFPFHTVGSPLQFFLHVTACLTLIKIYIFCKSLASFFAVVYGSSHHFFILYLLDF